MFPHTYSQNTSPNHQPDQYRHPCPHCDRVFVCPHNVLQHCREQHKELGYPKFPCTWPGCEKSFARNWPLSRHMERVHGVDVYPERGRRGEVGVYMRPARTRSRQSDVDIGGGKGRGTQMGRSSNARMRRQAAGGSNEGGRGQAGRGGRRGVGRRGPIRVRPLEEQKPWTVRIIEDEPEMNDYGADFVDDFDTGAGAEQISESPPDHEVAGAYAGSEVISCALCFETFEDREDLLGHLHLSHGLAYSEHCDCFVCSAKKISGMPFREDDSLKQVPESTQPQAQAGASETRRHDSVCEDTAMEIDKDSAFQDSFSNLTLVDETTIDEGEPVELEPCQPVDGIDFDTHDTGFIGAGYDETNFDYLDEDMSAWLFEAGAAFGGPGEAAKVVGESW